MLFSSEEDGHILFLNVGIKNSVEIFVLGLLIGEEYSPTD